MRIAIVGAGLAGSLLAWRLATLSPGLRVDLVTDGADDSDATAASGGLVRGFEVDPAVARDALASLVELTGDATLRSWSQYREIGSVYLCDGGLSREALAGRVGEIDRLLPGSARLVPAAHDGGRWAGLPEGTCAVVERTAGYYSPAALRRSLLEHLPGLGVTVVRQAVSAVAAADRPGGPHRLWPHGDDYDVVVLATGAGTAPLLTSSGLPVSGFRGKHIQYGVYDTTGEQPPSFVDDTSGLYGRPTVDGGMLLGVPSTRWDPPPGRPAAIPALQRTAERLAAERLPRMRLGALRRTVVGVDCYGEDGHLTLRAVAPHDRLYTFTGGSGCSAKTALAASLAAAGRLSSDRPPQPAGVSHSPRREADQCHRSI